MRRRIVLAGAAGLAFAAGVVGLLAPGAEDLWSHTSTALEAVDDGYWSAPVRRLAGAGDQDRYDHDLAVALALPQNALAATAVALGVPYPRARFAGSLVAAAVLAGCAVAGLAGRARAAGAVLLATLLAPPVLFHLASDLGEGTALGLAALWSLAALSRRWFLAGLLAAGALAQKALGLSLGVGTLVGVLASHGRRRDLPRAAAGVLVGLATTTALAVALFRDAPLAFLLRPWVATGDTQAGTRGLSILVQAAFLGHHGVGRWLLPTFGAALVVGVLAGPRRPSVAVLAATAAGFAFAGTFPDPWRLLPSLPLLAATLVDDPDPRPAGTRGPPRAVRAVLPALPALLALPQAVGGAVAWVGPSTALVLSGACVALGLACLAVRRAVGPRPRAGLALALVAAVAAAALSARVGADRARERVTLAADVARRVPATGSLVAYSFVATAFRGTLYYPPFQALWERELTVAGTPVLYRLRVPAAGEATPPPGPAGYRVIASDALGERLYNRDERPRPLLLETLARPR